MAEAGVRTWKYKCRDEASLRGEGTPVLCVVEVEVVLSAKLVVELLDGNELLELWVEADLRVSKGDAHRVKSTHLVAGHRVKEGRNTGEERVDPPSGVSHRSVGTLPTHDMLTTRPRPRPVHQREQIRHHSRST